MSFTTDQADLLDTLFDEVYDLTQTFHNSYFEDREYDLALMNLKAVITYIKMEGQRKDPSISNDISYIVDFAMGCVECGGGDSDQHGHPCECEDWSYNTYYITNSNRHTKINEALNTTPII